MQKLTPNQIVARFIKSRGRKLKHLAHDMEMPASTLSRSLKNLGNTKYDSAFAIRLAGRLMVPLYILEEACRKGKDLDQDVYQSLANKLTNYFGSRSANYMGEIFEVTKKLSEGDSYTLVTCYVPMECYNTKLAKVIADAIKKKVTFRYVFPDRRNKNCELVYENFIKRYLTAETRGWKDIESEFKECFITALEKKHSVSRDELHNQVAWSFTSDPILMTPFSKFILITQRKMGETEFMVFSEARIWSHDAERHLTCWYPIPQIEAQKIEEAINDIPNYNKWKRVKKD